MAVTVFSALLVGCGKDDDDGGKNNSVDRNLVCADGEAWVNDMNDKMGIIFRSNGEVLAVFTNDGNTWYVEENESGTYSTTGNTLTVKEYDSSSVTFPYSVSGNKLTLTFSDNYSEVYTKRSGINLVRDNK
jgi:hypothetical protein